MDVKEFSKLQLVNKVDHRCKQLLDIIGELSDEHIAALLTSLEVEMVNRQAAAAGYVEPEEEAAERV